MPHDTSLNTNKKLQVQDIFIVFHRIKKDMYVLYYSVLKLRPFYYSHIVIVIIQPRCWLSELERTSLKVTVVVFQFECF